MSLITIEKLDEVHCRVIADDLGVESELIDFFTYEYPGARFMPKYKAGLWDGKVRLLSPIRKTLYVGLIEYVKTFCEKNNYKLDIDKNLSHFTDIKESIVNKYIDSLNVCSRGVRIQPHDYQLEAVYKALHDNRVVLLSPTGSGKSLIIYALIRWHIQHGRKCIIVVPTTGLVEQLFSDFEDYSRENGWVVADHCQKLYSGFSKIFESDMLITTWQSIHRLPKQWFQQFDVVIGDECLHPDTPINMVDNTTKKIKDICPGDMVLTFNEQTHSVEPKPVVKVHRNISINERMYKVGLGDGTFVKITGNHKVLLTNGQWKTVDKLEIGDIINSIE